MPSITRKTQTDRQKRRDEITGQLLQAVEGLLKESGVSYTELSVDRICSEAGISRSTFYAYFEDKGHLLRELTRDILADVGTIAAEWWGSGPELARETYDEIVARLVARYHRHGELLGAVADTATYDLAVAETYGGMLGGFAADLEAMILRGRGEGWIRDAGPAPQIARSLLWMVVETCYHQVRGAEASEIEPIAAAISEISWSALYRT